MAHRQVTGTLVVVPETGTALMAGTGTDKLLSRFLGLCHLSLLSRLLRMASRRLCRHRVSRPGMVRRHADRRVVGMVVEVVRTPTGLVAVVGMEVGMAEDTEEGMVEATAEEEGVEGIRAEEVVVGEDTSVLLLLLLGSTLFLFCLPLQCRE